MTEKKPPIVVYFTHDPVVLRVEEMVDGEVGKVARQVGEIQLKRGPNEIDPDLWAKWLALNKDGPMAAFLHEEKTDATKEPSPEGGGSGRDGEPDASG